MESKRWPSLPFGASLYPPTKHIHIYIVAHKMHQQKHSDNQQHSTDRHYKSTQMNYTLRTSTAATMSSQDRGYVPEIRGSGDASVLPLTWIDSQIKLQMVWADSVQPALMLLATESPTNRCGEFKPLQYLRSEQTCWCRDCTIVVQGLLFLLPSSTAPTSSTSAAGGLPQQPPDPWCRHAHRYDALNLKMYTQALALHMYN
jgi:hypothetical protein